MSGDDESLDSDSDDELSSGYHSNRSRQLQSGKNLLDFCYVSQNYVDLLVKNDFVTQTKCNQEQIQDFSDGERSEWPRWAEVGLAGYFGKNTSRIHMKITKYAPAPGNGKV